MLILCHSLNQSNKTTMNHCRNVLPIYLSLLKKNYDFRFLQQETLIQNIYRSLLYHENTLHSNIKNRAFLFSHNWKALYLYMKWNNHSFHSIFLGQDMIRPDQRALYSGLRTWKVFNLLPFRIMSIPVAVLFAFCHFVQTRGSINLFSWSYDSNCFLKIVADRFYI